MTMTGWRVWTRASLVSVSLLIAAHCCAESAGDISKAQHARTSLLLRPLAKVYRARVVSGIGVDRTDRARLVFGGGAAFQFADVRLPKPVLKRALELKIVVPEYRGVNPRLSESELSRRLWALKREFSSECPEVSAYHAIVNVSPSATWDYAIPMSVALAVGLAFAVVRVRRRRGGRSED